MSFTFSTLLSMIIINAVFVIALNQVVKTSVINYFNIDLPRGSIRDVISLRQRRCQPEASVPRSG